MKLTVFDQTGLVYLDKDIVCINKQLQTIFIYRNDSSFELLYTFNVSKRTNKIKRFAKGFSIMKIKKLIIFLLT